MEVGAGIVNLRKWQQIAESRTTFVKNLKDVVDQYQLDGVDIDWEYPDPGQSAQNYLSLMKELREALPDKLISTAVISYGDDTGLGIPDESFELVDFINVMTYDGNIHASMEEFEQGINYWGARGVQKEKLNIGAPFYSRPSEVSFSKLVQFDPAAAQLIVLNITVHLKDIMAFRLFKRKQESPCKKQVA